MPVTIRLGMLAAVAVSLWLPAPGRALGAGQESDGDRVRLSNPHRVSRWAAVWSSAPARKAPSERARVLTRLKTMTPEGTWALVLVLEEQADADGDLWVRVRLPILPNNSTGWVRRERLGPYRRVRMHLVVERRRLRATLYRSGRRVFRARVGIGQDRWPTPRGRFYIRSKLRRFDDPVYGPVAFGTSARSEVLTDWPGGGFVGVHGTNQPWLLPGRVSHGCIRLRNHAIRRLARLMPIGTPLTIR